MKPRLQWCGILTTNLWFTGQPAVVHKSGWGSTRASKTQENFSDLEGGTTSWSRIWTHSHQWLAGCVEGNTWVVPEVRGRVLMNSGWFHWQEASDEATRWNKLLLVLQNPEGNSSYFLTSDRSFLKSVRHQPALILLCLFKVGKHDALAGQASHIGPNQQVFLPTA